MDRMTLGVVPRALINDFAVERFPLSDVLLAVDQRKSGAGQDRNVGAADDLQEAEGVLNLFVPPGMPVTTVMPRTSVPGELISVRMACMSVPPGPAAS